MALLLKVIRRALSWFGKRAKPQDPCAYVTAGLKRGPPGRSAAIALEEPEPGRTISLFGRRATH